MGKERYASMFKRLAAAREGALVAFTVLGDPSPEGSLAVMEAMIAGGADALELGIPFSDPVADGPTIQLADQRALAAGGTRRRSFELIARVRERHPALPIGLLVYANLLEARGKETFYREARLAGVDSVLVADVPTTEVRPYVAAAQSEGLAPVLIAASNCSPVHLAEIASFTEGYTYVVTRSGVTGADENIEIHQGELLEKLRSLGAPPALLGFGISKPEHVRAALASGAAGVICGSALVRLIEENLGNPAEMISSLTGIVRSLKQATL